MNFRVFDGQERHIKFSFNDSSSSEEFFQSGQQTRDNLRQMSGVNINGFTFVFGY